MATSLQLLAKACGEIKDPSILSANMEIVCWGQHASKPVSNYDLETSKHNFKQPANVLGRHWETCCIFEFANVTNNIILVLLYGIPSPGYRQDNQ